MENTYGDFRSAMAARQYGRAYYLAEELPRDLNASAHEALAHTLGVGKIAAAAAALGAEDWRGAIEELDRPHRVTTSHAIALREEVKDYLLAYPGAYCVEVKRPVEYLVYSYPPAPANGYSHMPAPANGWYDTDRLALMDGCSRIFFVAPPDHSYLTKLKMVGWRYSYMSAIEDCSIINVKHREDVFIFERNAQWYWVDLDAPHVRWIGVFAEEE